MGKEVKTNAMRILEKQKIPYTFQTYECSTFTDGMETVRQLGLNEKEVFKTLVAVGKSGNYFVFVIPVAEELDLKKAARAVGEKSVELIHVKDITKITGYVRGGCTSVGMKKQFPTVVHESALEHEKIWVSGGRIGLQIKLSPEDLLRANGGKSEDIIKR